MVDTFALARARRQPPAGAALDVLYAAIPPALQNARCDCPEGLGCFREMPQGHTRCHPCAEGVHAHGYLGEAGIQAWRTRARTAEVQRDALLNLLRQLVAGTVDLAAARELLSLEGP